MKRSRLISLLSALLVVTMLLVSCGNESSSENSGGNPAVVYETEALNKWFSYLEYKTPEAAAVLTKDFSYKSDNTVSLPGNSNIVIETNTSLGEYTLETEANGSDPAIYKADTTETVKVYNVLLDSPLIFTKSVTYVTRATRTEPIEPNQSVQYVIQSTDRAQHVSYDFDTVIEGLFMITITTPEMNDESQWINSYKYDIVYEDGKVLLSGLSDPTYHVGYNSIYTTLTVGGKVYVFDEGKLIYTFEDAGKEFELPVADLEYNGYMYAFDEQDLPYELQMLGYEKSLTVQIIDKDYKIVSEKTVTAGEYIRYNVLNSGDVLVTYAVYDNYESDDYTLSFYDEKYDIHQVLVKKDGTAQELELEFLVDTVYSPANEAETFKVKGSNNVAVAYDIKDGKISKLATVYVLDDSLQVVEALPNLVKNQSGIAAFIAADEFVVPTHLPEMWSYQTYNWTNTVYYSVASDNSGNAVRYANIDSFANPSTYYCDLGAGFMLNGIIYRNDLSAIKDLYSTYDNFYVAGDHIYGEVDVYGEDGNYEYTVTEVMYFKGNNFAVTKISESNVTKYLEGYYLDNLYVVGDSNNVSIYNIEGTSILPLDLDHVDSVTRLDDNTYRVNVYNSQDGIYSYHIIK